jgi:hypothetical protein
MSEQRCECCLKPTRASEAGARVFIDGKRYVWCLDCWDRQPDALEQYQNVGLLDVFRRERNRARK